MVFRNETGAWQLKAWRNILEVTCDEMSRGRDTVKVFPGASATVQRLMNHRSPKVPDEYLCRISSEIARDPVTTPCGNLYNRVDIERWLDRNTTEPFVRTARARTLTTGDRHLTRPVVRAQSGKQLSKEQLYPNISLRQAIERFSSEHERFLP